MLLVPLVIPGRPVTLTGTAADQAPSTLVPPCGSPRGASDRVLAAWADKTGARADPADALTALRAILVKAAPAPRTVGPRAPPSPAQIMDAAGWQARTVRGFFAGLKERQGIRVEAAERVRQIGP